MVNDKVDQEIIESKDSVEPMMTIPNAMRIDSYKLSKSIKEALINVEFDIVIDSIRIVARRVIPEVEEDEDE